MNKKQINPTLLKQAELTTFKGKTGTWFCSKINIEALLATAVNQALSKVPTDGLDKLWYIYLSKEDKQMVDNFDKPGKAYEFGVAKVLRILEDKYPQITSHKLKENK